jgi:hypothetical protein
MAVILYIVIFRWQAAAATTNMHVNFAQQQRVNGMIVWSLLDAEMRSFLRLWLFSSLVTGGCNFLSCLESSASPSGSHDSSTSAACLTDFHDADDSQSEHRENQELVGKWGWWISCGKGLICVDGLTVPIARPVPNLIPSRKPSRSINCCPPVFAAAIPAVVMFVDIATSKMCRDLWRLSALMNRIVVAAFGDWQQLLDWG